MNTKPASLHRRLLVAIALPLMLILLAGSVVDYRLGQETADTAYDQAILDAALDLAAHVRMDAGKHVIELSDEAEAMLRRESSDKVFFAIRDPAGHLLAGNAALPFLQSSTTQAWFADGEMSGQPIRIAVKGVDSIHGNVTINVAETVNRRTRARQQIFVAILAPNLLGIMATLLVVFLGVRRGLLPLAAVEREIASRSPRDLHPIDISSAPDEVQRLLARLNELFDLLQKAAEAQQRFLADAAHQLRTPLAGLQTQVDLAVADGLFSDCPERLARMEEATSRITHLINQLLIYARAETSSSLKPASVSASLSELVEQSASLFIDRAIEKNIDLGFEVSPVTVCGVAWMLKEALANLIDNALRYTPEGGTITVSCGIRRGCAILNVEDSGPGIPEAERGRVFERFYRIPGSPGDGCGLGLSIIREIAEFHGAEIQIEASEAGGARISIVFKENTGPC